MAEQHNPERVRALTGCAELYNRAASHLAASPPNYEEAAKAIRVALDTGDDIFQTVVLDYVMTGGFQKNLFDGLKERLDDER